jgi:SAM-dependent methyltransferase
MTDAACPPDFTTVTESPDVRATAQQMSILYTRYHLAFGYARDEDVLEVACGAGVGLGYLASVARSVVGSDIDEKNCRLAASIHRGRPSILVQEVDAQRLPFVDSSFGLAILFEAVYYLPHPSAFVREARRVLKPGGKLLISSVNCEWSGFNPSPMSTKYYSATELRNILGEQGFQVDMFAAFPESDEGILRVVTRCIKRLAVALHLIPRTMKGKEPLKRLFYGRLTPIPRELREGVAPVESLIPLREISDLSKWRMIYAVAEIQ